MTNQQQLNANRRNAKRSTGPRTPGGKRRARINALKHGMAAKTVVFPGEDPRELRASHKSFIAAWNPIGTIEAKLVWEITIADWRLRRARRMEPRLVEIGSARSEDRSGWNNVVFTLTIPRMRGLSDAESGSDELNEREAETESDESKGADPGSDRSAVYASEMFFGSEGGGPAAMQQLLRYEAAAERSYYRAFHTLERLQAKRMGKDVSPPQVMHVHTNK